MVRLVSSSFPAEESELHLLTQSQLFEELLSKLAHLLQMLCVKLESILAELFEDFVEHDLLRSGRSAISLNPAVLLGNCLVERRVLPRFDQLLFHYY
jgi:hypothetical protein